MKEGINTWQVNSLDLNGFLKLLQSVFQVARQE